MSLKHMNECCAFWSADC